MEMTKNDSTANSENIPQMPQVIYGYPPYDSRRDEIDLGELISKLIGQWKLMLSIIVVGTLLSVAIALYLPRIYKQEVILSRPYSADIAGLNATGYTQYNAGTVFTRYYNTLRSPNQLEKFIIDNKYLPKLYPNSESSDSSLIAGFGKNLKIEVLEPLPVKGGEAKPPQRVSINVEHAKEEVIADLLNDYVAAVEKEVISSFVREQELQISADLKTIERDIKLLRIKAKSDRERVIIKREEKNKESVKGIEAQMSALLSKANDEKNYEIVAVKVAYAMAKKLNIEKPTRLVEYGREREVEAAEKTEITLSDRQELPLYLMGTNYLEIKLEELTSRKDNVPFIDGYSSLEEKIKLIESDVVLEALKKRPNDDPYIEELPLLIGEKEKLKALSHNFENIKIMRIEKTADITGSSIKPNKKLIVLLGVVISVMLGLTFGLVVALIKGKSAAK